MISLPAGTSSVVPALRYRGPGSARIQTLIIGLAQPNPPDEWEYYAQIGAKALESRELKDNPPLFTAFHMDFFSPDARLIELKEYAEQILSGVIVFPTKQVFNIEGDMWQYVFEKNARSNRLWQFSLFWFSILAEYYQQSPNPAILSMIESQMESFIQWLDGDFSKLSLTQIPSADHAYASRCVAMCDILCLFPTNWKLRPVVLTLLFQHCDWLFSPPVAIRNNHGLIMLIGLARAASILRERSRSEDCLLNRLLTRIETESAEIYRFNFDSEGFARENSVGYQSMNMECLQDLLTVCHQFRLPVNLQEIERRIPDLQNILLHMLWQNGWLPPIGDTSSFTLHKPGITKNHWYREANWLILKNEERYCSFRCGFSSSAHKHVDEGSLTLRYRNHDILVDCGCYNYDRNDPIRRYVESARGHCGCYPVSLYPALAPEYCSKHHKASAIREVTEEDGITIARSFLELQSGFSTERVVTEQEGELTIQDSFRCERAEDVDVRFCLHPEAVVTRRNERQIFYQNGDVSFLLEILDSAPSCALTEESGFYAEKANVAENAPVVTFHFKNVTGGVRKDTYPLREGSLRLSQTAY